VTVPVAEEPTTLPANAVPVVEVRDLVVDYVKRTRTTRAVDGVSLAIGQGEILGLAGESGCGKTTLGNAIMQVLRPPARLAGGEVLFAGENLVGRSAEELRRFRWRTVSMVFQSAMNSLNPVMRVGDQFLDMMRAHERISRRDALDRAAELLDLVGIDSRRLRAYPHELSGGMRQRVIIGMALALRPELVIMDEPTTALDVVVQREILQQIQELQRELGFAVLFITHDLSLLLELAHRVAIMYAGEIVEVAPAAALRDDPRHPYTAGLLRSFPPLRGPIERMTGIPGSPPDLAAPPSGCRFHPRCPYCIADDVALYQRQVGERPSLREVAPGHWVACHLVEAQASKGVQ
jgi:peptide/nickel transport system ATP-binding protein